VDESITGAFCQSFPRLSVSCSCLPSALSRIQESEWCLEDGDGKRLVREADGGGWLEATGEDIRIWSLARATGGGRWRSCISQSSTQAMSPSILLWKVSIIQLSVGSPPSRVKSVSHLCHATFDPLRHLSYSLSLLPVQSTVIMLSHLCYDAVDFSQTGFHHSPACHIFPH